MIEKFLLIYMDTKTYIYKYHGFKTCKWVLTYTRSAILTIILIIKSKIQLLYMSYGANKVWIGFKNRFPYDFLLNFFPHQNSFRYFTFFFLTIWKKTHFFHLKLAYIVFCLMLQTKAFWEYLFLAEHKTYKYTIIVPFLISPTPRNQGFTCKIGNMEIKIHHNFCIKL